MKILRFVRRSLGNPACPFWAGPGGYSTLARLPAGPGSMMWIPWSQRVDRTATTHRGKPLRESTGQRQRTKPTRTTGQGLPAA